MEKSKYPAQPLTESIDTQAGAHGLGGSIALETGQGDGVQPQVAHFSGPLDWLHVVQWLHAAELISPEEAQRTIARFSRAESSQNPLVRLAGIALQRADGAGTLSLDDLAEFVARRAGMECVRIDPLKADVGRVAEVMSAAYASRYGVLPLQVQPREVVIATCEPFITDWVPEIERQVRRSVRLVMTNPLDLKRYIGEFYALASSISSAQKSSSSAGGSLASFEQLVELGRSNRQLDANDQGVVRVVEWLWEYAFDQRASDIHLEPRREQGAIRFRIDGVLHTVYQMPIGVLNAMIARIKLLGRIDVVEKRRPQDGRIKTRNPRGDEIEMRLSTLPTAFGEKMVMRIFDPDTTIKNLGDLGFSSHDAKRWEQLVKRPHGIILVTGPTGSGKTTTLYSTLKRLATDEVNVSTIEDPIEMIEPAFNQTQVQPQIDFGFAEGLRALMRQDPDIIMVGEIRDLETAEMAIQAALTGHLVFSTLHTNDAPSAITRLMELGVPAYLINATLLGVLAQRLVRTLCPSCKQPDLQFDLHTLEEAVRPWKINLAEKSCSAYKPVGCIACRMSGYRGRLGLYELLTVNEAVRDQIHQKLSLPILRREAVAAGMRPLRLGGAQRIADGTTTLEEILLATPAPSQG
ncbi:type II/IV secretion system protein [Corticibacter populi]|uniref:Type II/IV secretion system protein n=1 Tax=Corticibacter populi TaxID=1550736 RepID=A0A3M6QTL6_9BURK|nr:GspE/PulE family protein [Corticibacter populi]RMX06376.1 type II/IV secretion system protein [Corticibacter populi]RZS32078.1 general secretion pathway protein E [Corticibacter populi]